MSFVLSIFCISFLDMSENRMQSTLQIFFVSCFWINPVFQHLNRRHKAVYRKSLQISCFAEFYFLRKYVTFVKIGNVYQCDCDSFRESYNCIFESVLQLSLYDAHLPPKHIQKRTISFEFN